MKVQNIQPVCGHVTVLATTMEVIFSFVNTLVVRAGIRGHTLLESIEYVAVFTAFVVQECKGGIQDLLLCQVNLWHNR